MMYYYNVSKRNHVPTYDTLLGSLTHNLLTIMLTHVKCFDCQLYPTKAKNICLR